MRCVLAFALLLLGSTASAAVNCRDLLITTDVVALVRDGNDRLRPLFKAAADQLESHINGQRENWDYRREGVVVPLRIVNDVTAGHLGGEAAWLPRELKSLLARGGRFETTADAGSASPYALWMMAPPEGSRRRGRTGTLLHRGRPIVVTDPAAGAEYVIEVKGAGLPTGGFAESSHYKALQGGLWERQGEIEFTRFAGLLAPRPGDSVKALGWQRFRGPFGGQDLLYRLTPGNLRASLRGTAGLVRTPAQTDALVGAAARQLGEVLAAGHFAYTHPENLVVDADGSRAWLTDLLDVLPLRQLPRRVESVVMDEFLAVATTLATVFYFSDYQGDRHWPLFRSAVVDVLVERGVVAPGNRAAVDATEGPKPAALELLRAGLAARIVRERQRHGYDPLDDADLAGAVNAPCTPPEPREHGRQMIAFYRTFPVRAEDAGTANMVADLIAEAERLARGEVTFLEWLNLPTTKLLVAINAAPDLEHAYLPSDKNQPFDFVLRATANAFPGWFEFKRHIEREFVLLSFALESHPEATDLAANFAAVGQVAKDYVKGLSGDFVASMCRDGAAFRRRFKLPYHRP